MIHEALAGEGVFAEVEVLPFVGACGSGPIGCSAGKLVVQGFGGGGKGRGGGLRAGGWVANGKPVLSQVHIARSPTWQSALQLRSTERRLRRIATHSPFLSLAKCTLQGQ